MISTIGKYNSKQKHEIIKMNEITVMLREENGQTTTFMSVMLMTKIMLDM